MTWLTRGYGPNAITATWGDYLRQRNRSTQSDLEAGARAQAFDRSAGGMNVRRRLERPFGSVRWQAETPDRGDTTSTIYPLG